LLGQDRLEGCWSQVLCNCRGERIVDGVLRVLGSHVKQKIAGVVVESQKTEDFETGYRLLLSPYPPEGLPHQQWSATGALCHGRKKK
jgi:hypothetical protein